MNCQWLAKEHTSGQGPSNLHLQADLYTWLSFYCARLCSTKFEQGLLHKEARNQIKESPSFTLRAATKGMRQEYHDSTIRQRPSKEENTPVRLPLRYVQVSRTSSSLATKGELIVFLIFYLYNISTDVSSELRDLLCILKKTLVFFVCFLIGEWLQNVYIYAQESLGEGHPTHNVCESSSISPPANTEK